MFIQHSVFSDLYVGLSVTAAYLVVVGEGDDGGADPEDEGGVDLAVRVRGGLRVVARRRQVLLQTAQVRPSRQADR